MVLLKLPPINLFGKKCSTITGEPRPLQRFYGPFPTQTPAINTPATNAPATNTPATVPIVNTPATNAPADTTGTFADNLARLRELEQELDERKSREEANLMLQQATQESSDRYNAR